MKAFVFFVLLAAAQEEAHPQPRMFRAPESPAARSANITTLSLESSKAEVDFETYCRPPADRGPCKGYFPSWWYNAGRRQCEEFVYTGCAGNKNNYVTKEECERTCLRERDTPEESTTQNPMYREYEEMITCHLEPDQGSCREHIPRYYYDWRSRACKQFIYGGCLGNTNNFVSMEVCQQKCSKEANPQPRLFRAPEIMAVRLANATTLSQESSKTEVDFETYCRPPADRGPCKGYFPSWWYNAGKRQCEEFVYTGCAGNRNNYVTKEECERTCLRERDSPKESTTQNPMYREYEEMITCHLEPDQGSCRERIPRYYYDWRSGACKQFIYGGCLGNPNNFVSMEVCQQKCAKDAHPQSVLLRVPEVVDPVCLEPKKPGRCKGYFPRYYFNTTLKTCQEFIYGGCDANRNNFATLEECKNTCWVSMNQRTVELPEAFDVPYWPHAIPEDCAHPPDMGPCKASIPRFFYNTVSKSCVQFLYGGCGGNANNFLTYTQCEEKCKTLGSVIPRA